MKNKKVSIIVPVYNTQDYLENCLDSLVNQTLKDIEIIVVNDGSPDNSQEIIDRYIKKYPDMVKGVLKENGGLSDARNYGVKYATGEFIAFVDSDDYVELDTYEKLYNYALQNELDVVCFAMYEFSSKGKRVLEHHNISADIEKFNYVLFEPSACQRLIKSDIWFNNNLQFAVGLFYEDLELMPRLILYTEKIGILDEPYYNYVIREGSIMNQPKYNPRFHSIFTVMKSLRENFLDTKYIEELEFIHIDQLLHLAMLRSLPYQEGKDDIFMIASIMKESFPKWYKNKYFKQKSWKYKTVCFLTYLKQISLLKLLVG